MSQNDIKTQRSAIDQCLQSSRVGKRLPNALYVHKSALTALDPRLQSYERSVRGVTEETQQANLVKFTIEPPKISYLFYPDFDTNPHPALQSSIIVDPVTSSHTKSKIMVWASYPHE